MSLFKWMLKRKIKRMEAKLNQEQDEKAVESQFNTPVDVTLNQDGYFTLIQVRKEQNNEI